ncbi:coatomer subunit delta [[Candida] anglica]|uniref:Coatomer subunit delta n=1 Tax=[Candida] anglica TaxID=148631 RepID=A0ABP0ENE3_9ASCO
MVVLASSICTRGGKALLSRQFRDLSKDRITALLANFPSLISNSGSQNTTVEDEHVRYVYQPLEEFYIVLITTKNSNILQDIDTLHLFASTVSNLLRSIDEREIFDNAFEILGAFDEIINLGFKENLTLSQVQTFLEMDSYEEKIQEVIDRNKELEATEERKRRAKEIHRKELARRTMEKMPSVPSQNTYGYDSYNNNTSSSNYSQAPSYESNTIIDNAPAVPAPRHGPTRGGLQLGKKANNNRAVPAEVNQPLLTQSQPTFQHHTPAPAASQSYHNSAVESSTASPAPQTPKVVNNGILITISEKVNAELTREGAVVKTEVKGDLKLRINNPEYAHSKILLKTAKSGVQYKARPEVDTKLFTQESIIALKDKSKSFPSNDQSLGVLRWRVVGKEDDTNYLPVIITAWVNVNDGVADVTLEYELTSSYTEGHPTQEKLENVQILVPIQSHDVNLKDDPENVSFEVSDYGVIFNIDEISLSEPSGSFEFSIPSPDEDSLFPMELQFEVIRSGLDDTDVSFGKVQVLDVVSSGEDEESLPFDLHSTLNSDGYQIN